MEPSLLIILPGFSIVALRWFWNHLYIFRHIWCSLYQTFPLLIFTVVFASVWDWFQNKWVQLSVFSFLFKTAAICVQLLWYYLLISISRKWASLICEQLKKKLYWDPFVYNKAHSLHSEFIIRMADVLVTKRLHFITITTTIIINNNHHHHRRRRRRHRHRHRKFGCGYPEVRCIINKSNKTYQITSK